MHRKFTLAAVLFLIFFTQARADDTSYPTLHKTTNAAEQSGTTVQGAWSQERHGVHKDNFYVGKNPNYNRQKVIAGNISRFGKGDPFGLPCNNCGLRLFCRESGKEEEKEVLAQTGLDGSFSTNVGENKICRIEPLREDFELKAGDPNRLESGKSYQIKFYIRAMAKKN